MTSLAEERDEQSRWRPRPGAPLAALHSALVENEFLEPDRMAARTAVRLGWLLAHARQEVPYYSQRAPAPSPRPFDDLRRFPVLRRNDLIENFDDLRARRLPKGEEALITTRSSGTTGRQTTVLQTYASNRMFDVLAQRNYRWFRFDPTAKFASIRRPTANPSRPDGSTLADGDSGRLARWRYGGTTFETGPYVYMNATNPLESQIGWLEREQPRYLQSYATALGHLAFACEGAWPATGIEKLQAVSERLTAPTRAKVERTLRAPIELGYGLNEVGIVAGRCHAGRYHVHVEHCLVEILDDAGEACRGGGAGRVVVTALGNPAMPLIRYDTGDIALAADGPCACGRLLPSFIDVVGHGKFAALPPGSVALVDVIDEAVNGMPAALAAGLRQFQVHQSLDGGFELRIVSLGEPSAAFLDRLRDAWIPAAGGLPLRVRRVEHIERHRGGKWPSFTSDFLPTAPAPRP